MEINDQLAKGSHRKFRPAAEYKPYPGESYSLSPLRFLPLDEDRYVITNLVGEHLVLPREELHQFLRKRLPVESPYYRKLLSRHFLMDSKSHVSLDLLAAKYRTKQLPLSRFTSLHIFVITLRCNNRCCYCQASRQGTEKQGYDMTEALADRAIEFMFRGPSSSLKVEFQGGEPLLNLPLLRYIVSKVESRNAVEKRNVEFVICSNLFLLSDEVLDFCLEHNIYISTSLDGPESLHNLNRPSPELDSHEATARGISRAQQLLGPHRVSALMTTTRESLSRPKEIVDEYLRLGFRSLFVRKLNPYGLAARTESSTSYTVEEWLEFYKKVLAYIVELNIQGVPFREEYAALILRKVLTPFGTGFVDLQSPAGIGISVIVYNYNGGLYASDESRMLAEMGDEKFRLGDLMRDSFEDIMLSDFLVSTLKETMAEGVPGCADCALMPFCGSDPVRHYRTQRDLVGFKPTSDFCRKNMGIIKHLICLLEDDPMSSKVLRQWV